MPIRKVSGGFKWGDHGKVYPTHEQAVKQAQAAYSNGYKGYAEGGKVTEDNMNELINKYLKRALEDEISGAKSDVLDTILDRSHADADDEEEKNAEDVVVEDDTQDEPAEHDATDNDSELQKKINKYLESKRSK